MLSHGRVGRVSRAAMVALAAWGIVGCRSIQPINWGGHYRPNDRAAQLLAQMKQAHGGEAWHAATAIEFVAEIDFGPLQARHRFVWEVAGGRILCEDADSGPLQMGFDGQVAWIAPASEAEEFPAPPRYHVLMWPFLLGTPFKLNDPATRLEYIGRCNVVSIEYEVVRVSFEPGTGDTPDDWFMAYLHPRTHRLELLRYVTTYPGVSRPGREHIIRFSNFVDEDGLTIAREWSFHLARNTGGLGKRIGRARISGGIQPVGLVDRRGFFQPPNSAITIPRPILTDD